MGCTIRRTREKKKPDEKQKLLNAYGVLLRSSFFYLSLPSSLSLSLSSSNPYETALYRYTSSYIKLNGWCSHRKYSRRMQIKCYWFHTILHNVPMAAYWLSFACKCTPKFSRSMSICIKKPFDSRQDVCVYRIKIFLPNQQTKKNKILGSQEYTCQKGKLFGSLWCLDMLFRFASLRLVEMEFLNRNSLECFITFKPKT